MPQEFNHRRIADPVHGTIGLSAVEAAVIDTAVFQRLRQVKQLGLANLVFPGADYSRFSHCIGVCHIVGRMMETLLQRQGPLDDDACRTVQLFRLAGLLHDIGHYPFSHATEDAIKNHYAPTLLDDGAGTVKRALEHEDVGAKIIKLDASLQTAIRSGGFEPTEIGALFRRDELKPYSNLIASDLDADRVDYLLRTSHFSGLPYGSIDLDYMISQICTDDKGDVALTVKALRAVDHFLLCRILDYRQVAYHRTVAAYEWLLQDVLRALLRVSADLDWSEDGVEALLLGRTWARFTDSFVMERIQQELDKKDAAFGNPIDAEKAAAIIARRTPKAVAEIERYERRERRAHDPFRSDVHQIKQHIPRWASDFGIDQELWKVWHQSIKLTSIGSHYPASMRFTEAGADELDEYEQTVRLVRKPGLESNRIIDIPQSLTSILADYDIKIIRVYVLLPQPAGELAESIAARIRQDLPNSGWLQ